MSDRSCGQCNQRVAHPRDIWPQTTTARRPHFFNFVSCRHNHHHAPCLTPWPHHFSHQARQPQDEHPGAQRTPRGGGLFGRLAEQSPRSGAHMVRNQFKFDSAAHFEADKFLLCHLSPWLAFVQATSCFRWATFPVSGQPATTSRSRGKGRRSSSPRRACTRRRRKHCGDAVHAPYHLPGGASGGHSVLLHLSWVTNTRSLATQHTPHKLVYADGHVAHSYQKAMTSMAKYETVRPCTPALVFSSHIRARPFFATTGSLLSSCSSDSSVLLSSFHFHSPLVSLTSFPIMVLPCGCWCVGETFLHHTCGVTVGPMLVHSSRWLSGQNGPFHFAPVSRERRRGLVSSVS